MIPDWLEAYEGHLDLWVDEIQDEKIFDYNALDMTRPEVVRLYYYLFENFEIDPVREEELKERFRRMEVLWWTHDDKDAKWGKTDGNKPPKSGKKKRGAPSAWPEHKKLLTQEDWDSVAGLGLIEARDRLVDIMSERYFGKSTPATKRMTKRARRRNIENELKSRR